MTEPKKRRVRKGGVQPKGGTVVGDRLFLAILKQQGLPAPTPEYQFHPTRRWRWDWCWPDHKLALEVQGGIWAKGAHSSGVGIQRDIEKFSEGAALGWRLLLCEPKNLPTLGTADLIRRALRGRTEG